jgi:hypothetical protein
MCRHRTPGASRHLQNHEKTLENHPRKSRTQTKKKKDDAIAAERKNAAAPRESVKGELSHPAVLRAQHLGMAPRYTTGL